MKNRIKIAIRVLVIPQILLLILKRILIFTSHWTDAVAVWFFWIASAINVALFVLVLLLVLKAKNVEKRSNERNNDIAVMCLGASALIIGSNRLIDADVVFNAPISDWVYLGFTLFNIFACLFFMICIWGIDSKNGKDNENQ